MIKAIKRFILNIRLKYHRKRALYCCDRESRSTEPTEKEYFKVLKTESLVEERDIIHELMKLY